MAKNNMRYPMRFQVGGSAFELEFGVPRSCRGAGGAFMDLRLHNLLLDGGHWQAVLFA